jgi:hypothetical protein
MLRLRLAACALAGILLAGCDLGTFYADLQGETTVAGSPLADLLSVFPPIGSFTNVDFNESQDFQNAGITKDDVQSVTVSAFSLKIASPSTQDFSFLDEISFYAKAGDTEELIAGKTGVANLDLSAPNPELTLEVEPVELQPFVTAPTMSIVVRGNGRHPPSDTTLQANVRLRVGVKLF